MAKYFDVNRAIQDGADPIQVQAFMKANNLLPLSSQNKQSTIQPPAEESNVTRPSGEGGLRELALNLLPIGGAIAGGVGGGLISSPSILGIPAGIIAGGAAGSAGGEALRQRLSGENDLRKVATEGALGAIGGPVGKVVGKGASLVGKTIGKGVVKSGVDLALKAIRPTKTQLTKFVQQFGEDMTQVLARNNIVGKTAEEIGEQAIKPLQQSFDNIVVKSGVKVNPSTLDNAFYRQVKTLLDSPSSADNKLAGELLEEYDNIIGKIGTDFDISKINKFRQVFDSKVKDFIMDPIQAGKNRLIGNALRQSVQESADISGLRGPGGQTLKELGMELSKLYHIQDLAQLQANLGRGNLPVGLLTLLGLGGGGTLGGIAAGVPGGIAVASGMLAITKLLNNPKAIAVASKLMQRLGGGLEQGLPDIAGKVISQGTGQTISRGAGALFMPPDSQTNQATQQEQADQLHTLPSISQPPGKSQTLPDIPQNPYPVENYVADITRDPKNASQYKAIYDAYQKKYGKEKGTGGQAEVALNVVTELENLYKQVQKQGLSAESGGLGRIAGAVKGDIAALLQTSPQAATYKDQRAAFISLVVRGLGERGVLTDRDVNRVVKAVPTFSDSPKTAAEKWKLVKTILETASQKLPDIIQTEPSTLPNIDQFQFSQP